ncbi:site-specific integrase [Ochrobactrum sp. Marseille-Q0166]|uniref:tyrosine-type recombinase/integrase n=1 Tax=Ochrobactrum sp. Marseille-Q0166 TaxID=2761105 RepID=UPI001FFF9656|nr:site-specific integrase [Ochrobactrum sp. Marseille-Q0166]
MPYEIRQKLFRGKWYAVWHDGVETKRRSLRTTDSDGAARRLEDFKRDFKAPVGSLVGDIVRAYLDARQGKIADPARLRFAWKQAESHFAHLRPDQITEDICSAYAETRYLAGRKEATVLKEINVVRQALNWHGASGAKFEAPAAPPPRDRHLTKDEYRKLLSGCATPHMQLFCILALTTAARKSAILELTWDRVDFDRKLIKLGIPGDKNRKGRAIVPMTESSFKALQDAYAARQSPYVVEYGGDRVLDIKKGFAAAVRRSGLVDVVPHDLRHSAAVWMAEAGVSMDEIAQYLGHSTPAITFKVYARFSPDYLRKAASSLEF